MDGALVDERRIKVDFSNSVAKLWNQHRRKQLSKKAQDLIIQQASD
jgi:peptidyl-prolyl cis-trans isomerase-like 4